MLLDEPLSALDLKLRQHMRAELRAIQKRTNVTFIYITHDQGEALAMSDRVGVMSQGKLQQVGRAAGDLQPSGQRLRRLLRRREQHLRRPDRQRRPATTALFETSVGTFRATLGPGVDQRDDGQALRAAGARAAGRRAGQRARTPFRSRSPTSPSRAISSTSRCATATAGILVVEARNDGSTPVPPPGEKLHLVFDAERAVILADETAGAPRRPA